MNTPLWGDQIELQFSETRHVCVESPSEAYDLLSCRWPTHSGLKYWSALELCVAAIEGRAPVAKAKEAFVTAALEAGLKIIMK